LAKVREKRDTLIPHTAGCFRVSRFLLMLNGVHAQGLCSAFPDFRIYLSCSFSSSLILSLRALMSSSFCFSSKSLWQGRNSTFLICFFSLLISFSICFSLFRVSLLNMAVYGVFSSLYVLLFFDKVSKRLSKD